MTFPLCLHCRQPLAVPVGHSRPFIRCAGCGRMSPLENRSDAARETTPTAGFSHGDVATTVSRAASETSAIETVVSSATGPNPQGNEVATGRIASASESGLVQSPTATGRDLPVPGKHGEDEPQFETLRDVPCRWCREPVRPGARQCPHCGERLGTGGIEQARSAPAFAYDMPLQLLDWVAVFACPPAGMILGGLWFVRGHPKGPRMVGVSLVWAVMILGFVKLATWHH